MTHIFCWIVVVSAVLCTIQRLREPVGWFHEVFAFVVITGGAITLIIVWAYFMQVFFEKLGWIPS